ncbi:MAG: hypothetical protein J7K23_07275 [Thermoproteales archaeon]|nr:hypothetical protein [Thermoproteales archaeon]
MYRIKSPWSIIIITSFFLNFTTFIIAKMTFFEKVFLIELPILLLISGSIMLVTSILMSIRSIYGSIFFLISLGTIFWFIGFVNRSMMILYQKYVFPMPFDSFFLAGNLLFSMVFVFFMMYIRKILTSTIQKNMPILMVISLVSGIFYAFITASYLSLFMQGQIQLPLLMYVIINIFFDLVTIALYIILVLAVKEGVINQIIRAISFGLILILLGDYLYFYINLGKLLYLSDFPFPIYGWAYNIFLLSSIYIFQIQTGKKV